MADQKIKGITEEQFIDGCKQYLLTNKDSLYKRILQEVCNKNGHQKPLHPDNVRAEHLWIEEKMFYIQ